ncbi:MAG: response regulator [bacterium]|nr:response regulator [bacterium]
MPESRSSGRLLVVEDEGITAIDTGDLLRGLGYEIAGVAYSGEDAIRRADELRPDLVLMDIRLRGAMDGVAAARAIHTRFGIPVVFATAYADDATLARARLAEPFGYVLKPFHERELRSTVEVALFKHRMERQRADVLAMLSHDIRNPLGVILAYSEMLAEELARGPGPQAEDLVRRVTATARAIHGLLTNYLDASRIETGRLCLARDAVAVNEVVARVCQQYDTEARRRGVSLVMQLAPSLPPAAADGVACERIVTNLLHNALKFTPRAGAVTLRSTLRAGMLTIEVADTGPGIPASRLPHLFDRYQQTAAARDGGGTGLGLFIVKTLAEAQGGRVGVDSAPGRGTCFTLSLPLASGAAAAAGD